MKIPFLLTGLVAFFTVPLLAGEAIKPPVYQEIAIAADHAASSAAGLEVYAAGGNVVDVAAAVGFAQAVVRPASSGLGGGGFMVIWDASQQKAVAIDYRERAPAAATRDMYLDESGEAVAQLSRMGHLAVAVPHQVAGLCYAVKHYGKLELAQVMAPAIRLAREGVPLDPHSVAVRRGVIERMERHPELEKRFPALVDLYLNDGKVPEVGDLFISPIADILAAIAKEGPSAFYQGPAAEALVREIQQGGGIITMEDLSGTKATERKALVADFAGGKVVSMPPPSSGGVALIEILNILEAFETEQPKFAEPLHENDSVLFRHVLTEAMKHAFADRATYLGDPDYTEIPVETLISREYARKLASRIKRDHTRPLKYYGRAMPIEDAGTTHFSVIDAEGNAVACTETVNLAFGSKVVVPETGVVLNDEMDDFAAKPGTPNAFGLVQSEHAAIGPGRRPLSSMTPTIFVRDGKAVASLGASGGPRIITATLQVLLNVTRFDMLPRAAVRAPRQHHQWLPNVLLMEPELFEEFQRDLEKLGHEVERRGAIGTCQIVTRRADGLRAASDPRKGGAPAGK